MTYNQRLSSNAPCRITNNISLEYRHSMEYSQSEYRKMKVPGNKSSWAISLLAAKVPGSERVRERNRQ